MDLDGTVPPGVVAVARHPEHGYVVKRVSRAGRVAGCFAGVTQSGISAARAPARHGRTARTRGAPVVRAWRGETRTCHSTVVRASSARPASRPANTLIGVLDGVLFRDVPRREAREREARGRIASPQRLLGVFQRPNRPRDSHACHRAAGGTPAAPRAMTVPSLAGYDLALSRGTRSPTGAPGPRYWQQWADYKLEAELNPDIQAPHRQGRHHLLQPLARHARDGLHPAAAEHLRPRRAAQHRRALGGRGHRARAAWPRRAASCATASGGARLRGGRDDHAPPAARPLPPGGTADFAFDWKLRVPPDGAPRGGQDGEVFFINYWYPQMAVYDDVNGWQIDQYLGNAEFYMGYGNYDVSPDRAGRMAGDGHGHAAEPERGADRADPRAARLRADRHRHRARRDRPRPRGRALHDRGQGRQAHLALPRRERARRRLGRVGPVSLGRHQRRGRATPTATAGRTRADRLVLPPRAAASTTGTRARATDGTRSSSSRSISGPIPTRT